MITNIRLQNFRSYVDESFEFSDGVNIIVGPNGVGKTNLLEAILFLSRGQSYRAKPADLIRFEQDWARLDADFDSSQRIVKIKANEDTLKPDYEIDGRIYRRLGTGKFVPVVLFEPNDLQLLIRSPEMRREYIDGLLARTDTGFSAIKNTYTRTLRQRNALLKRPDNSGDELFVWNVQLSEAGARLAQKRIRIISAINDVVTTHYQNIAQKPTALSLIYQTTLSRENYGSSFLKKLEASEQLDRLRGFTGSGPHRDDIAFEIDGQPAVSSASRGETRTILLALKIFEMELLENVFQSTPILLLDDVFSELDGKRRRYLVESLKQHQVFITTTDADAVIEHFTTGHNLIAL